MDSVSVMTSDERSCCRGPGELLGSVQSGYLSFMTLPPDRLLSELDLVDRAKRAAEEVLGSHDYQLPAKLGEHMQKQGFPKVDDFEI